MPRGDYFFKLYYQRLITSTVGWSDEEFGAYMRLLIYQFDKGSIPKEMREIVRIAPAAKKCWGVLSQKFTEDGNGGMINRVMDDVRNDRLKTAEKNRENGSRGGRPVKTQSVIEKEPTGNPLGFKNETQTKPTPLASVSIGISGKEGGGGEGKPLGSELVTGVANEAWQDQHWRQQLCIGLYIATEDHLRRWMAQFNASLSSDTLDGKFDQNRYKKMLRGWIVKQQEKGVKVEQEKHPETSSAHRLTKII